MSRPKAIPHPGTYRQSLLAGFETCARRTRFDLQRRVDASVGYSEASADLGRAFHAVAAAALRTLYRQGHEQMPTQEIVEVMYETLAAGDFVLPADERDALRWMLLGFCEFKWNTTLIMALEERLSADVVCQDGKARTVTGQPDVLIADPPSGLIIVDFKTGRGKPKAPRQAVPEDETITGKQYLSERGHFQLDLYGYLAMRHWPAVERVTLRELHLRSGEVREAVLTRPELEHVEREIGLHMQLLDRAIAEGPKSKLWTPRPGKHCLKQCPVSRSCPVPREQRGVGALATDKQADAEAARFMVIDALRQQMRDRLKAYHEETHHDPVIGDGNVLRWDPPTGKGRKFGVHPPQNGNGAAA